MSGGMLPYNVEAVIRSLEHDVLNRLAEWVDAQVEARHAPEFDAAFARCGGRRSSVGDARSDAELGVKQLLVELGVKRLLAATWHHGYDQGGPGDKAGKAAGDAACDAVLYDLWLLLAGCCGASATAAPVVAVLAVGAAPAPGRAAARRVWWRELIVAGEAACR